MKQIIILILISWSIQSTAQSIDYNQFSSQIFDSDSEKLFSKSDFVDSLIKDKRIILLGELDHGDGSSFKIKTDLIKYLHEKHGFNKLVIESGLINCDQLWNSVEKENSVLQLAKDHIYYIWSQVKETERLFKYIDSEYYKDKPLKIVGIDPQFSGKLKEVVFIDLIQKELGEQELKKKELKELSYELKIMSKWLHFPKKDEHQITESTFYAHLDYYKNKILSETTGKEKELWNIYFENIKTFATIKWERREGSFEIRDHQMFKNLKYWLEENKDEKIIVWAANAHIIRNDGQLEGKDSDYNIIGIKKLGDHVFSEYPNDAYSIAISARTGKTLNFLNKNKNNKIKKNQSCSLEEKLKGPKMAFIDLNLFENSLDLGKYESQLFYPNIKCISKWSNHFDAIIFIDEMKPSTPTW